MADGQVTRESEVVKPNVRKTRRIGENVIGGFAGASGEAGWTLCTHHAEVAFLISNFDEGICMCSQETWMTFSPANPACIEPFLNDACRCHSRCIHAV